MQEWVCAAATSTLLGLALAACGQVNAGQVDSGPGNADAAGVLDGGEPDGGDGSDGATATCTPDLPIVRVEAVAGLNGRPFQCCAVLADPLTVYYAAGDGNVAEAADIYRATRQAPGEPFGSPELIIGEGSSDSFWAPAISSDGLVLYYNRAPGVDVSQVKIHRSSRGSTDGDFDEEEVVSLGAGSLEPESDPTFSDAGLFFTRQNRIFFAGSTGADFESGELVAETAPAGDEERDFLPAVSVDRKTLYWGSDRVAPGALGDFDIWVAEQISDEEYGSPRLVSGINSDSFDAPSWISPDGCELYFTTTRSSFNEIWVGLRDPR